MPTSWRFLVLLTIAILLPAELFAQAATAGTVKDASVAVLPGVSVEAANPALIEKVRTVVTDGVGQYRDVDLRPGNYAVTFTLNGFSTAKRDGIEVTGAGVFAINVEMRLGAVAETITVSGETPVVDTQSVRRQVVLSSDVFAEIPVSQFVGVATVDAESGCFKALTRSGSRCSIGQTHQGSPMCSFLWCLSTLVFRPGARVRLLIYGTTKRRECDD